VLENSPVSDIKTFQAETAMPYLLDPTDEAKVLVVTFPAYRTGVVEPPMWQRSAVGELKAHRLLLGSDEHTYWGPAQECRGLRTAVRLVEEVTAELEVEPEDVYCIGSSNAGVLALLTGLSYGAGALILGGPPVNLGTLLNRWATVERREGRKPMSSAGRLLDLARRDGGPDAVEWLDGLIPSLAADCPHPCRVRILATPNDFVFPGINHFYEERFSFPNVDIELDLTDAETHDDMAKEFYGHFLVRAVAEELGWV
jgi:hypothetical protein